MDSGRCSNCGRPYTVGEVTGTGILRTRPASDGGPLVEFRCPACDRVLNLVPHGQGRYALPGEPPPPPVPVEARAPPWVARASRGKTRPDPPEPERVEIPAPEPEPTRAAPPTPPPGADDDLTPEEALRVLGLEATADREGIERAFRRRSRTCHPDKVAHLDEEFQALAEEKFRRLKRAYDLITSL